MTATACHGSLFVEGFYQQLDSFVGLYNDKFAIPAKEIRDLLIEEEILTKGDFDEAIVEKYIAGRKEHEWYIKGFDPAQVEEMKKYYRDRYQQDVN